MYILNIVHIWRLIDLIQYVAYAYLLNVAFPYGVDSFLKIFQFSRLQFFSGAIKVSGPDYIDQTNAALARRGIMLIFKLILIEMTTVFLKNFFSPTITFLGVVIIYFLVSFALPSGKSTLVRWSFLLTISYLVCPELLFSGFLQSSTVSF